MFSSSSRLSNLSLSSARSISSTDVPRILMPARCSFPARLMGVCPPNCTITPSGFSFSSTFSTSSASRGSKYRRSAVSKSVLTVSGLLLIMMASIPSSLMAHTECTEQ